MQLLRPGMVWVRDAQVFMDSEWAQSATGLIIVTPNELDKRVQMVGVVADPGTLKEPEWPYDTVPIANPDVAVGDVVLFVSCLPHPPHSQLAQEISGQRFGDPGDYIVPFRAILGTLSRV